VSWNGATEVATWTLYKADDHGNADGDEPVASMPRLGFETAISYRGFATYVFVEGLDGEGNVLGRSQTVKTVVSAKLSVLTVAQESQWLEEMRKLRTIPHLRMADVVSRSPSLMFAVGTLCGMALVFGSRAMWRGKRKRSMFSRRWGGPLYRLLSQADDTDKD
jgi:hypothetical protein